MFEDLKDNDLLLIILGILVLHVGYSMYTYCTKPKIQEGFYKSCDKKKTYELCSQNSDCCSEKCEKGISVNTRTGVVTNTQTCL
jgi:hypothetical protein